MVSTTESTNNVFEQLEAYPWTTDTEFQSGLTAILGPDPLSLDESRLQDLNLHARCFYFSRKFHTNIDFDSYRKWRESKSASELTSAIVPATGQAMEGGATSRISVSQDSRDLSFAEVMELVQTGQPIPGVKDVPDIVMEGKGTEASKPERSKPWEITEKKGSGLFGAPNSET